MVKVDLLTINSKIYLVAIMFFAISVLTATAQTPITVTTDKTSYSDGDTIIVSGTVAEQISIPISIVIKDSSQTPVYIAQTSPNANSVYSTQVVAGGDLWKNSGTYEIDVTYGGPDKTAKMTFEFTATHAQPASNMTSQTNTTQAIPEFGSLSALIFTMSILAVIVMYAKTRPLFKA
jgi:hypothetical protein